ncbi:MAG: hypothetical protein MPW13_19415 [Candidatus Manganitrophus sp.]|nr:hypothetical protein [Candidatus Manganitrophus sp.]
MKLAPANGEKKNPKSIADVLEMTVSEALAFFAGDAEVARSLEPLQAMSASITCGSASRCRP